MKVRIKEVPEGVVKVMNDLTVGKIYDCRRVSPERSLATIENDLGEVITIYIPNCAYLGGGSWEIIPDEVKP